MLKLTHISFYKFTLINDPEGLCQQLRLFCKKRGLLGTVLIASEGLNGMIAGEAVAVEEFKTQLKSESGLEDLVFKQSPCEILPFKKLLVKVKKQILTMRSGALEFPFKTAPYIKPEELNRWIKKNEDFTMIDVRNQFEVEMGSFENAKNPQTKNFSEFPEYIKKNKDELKNKKIVTFCTGGIRCEKATAVLLREGFENVFQLDGGILNYFSKTDGAGFRGDCFVFDERIALDKNLQTVVKK